MIYEIKKIDKNGFIIFDNLDTSIGPHRILPWLSKETLEKRTLKIEVTYQQELVLLRFIHLDKFNPIRYSKIMLEIANNIT